MRLAEVCVNRPVFTTMLIGFLTVLGVFSYLRLGVDLFPKIDFPTVVITTRLEGASPEEMETEVTKLIEEVVNTVNGLDELRSVSLEGFSQVIAQFVLERKIEQAAQDVRDKVATIAAKFPEGTDPPVIEKFDPDAQPIMFITVSGSRDIREVTEIADKKIKQPLETVKDIGSITLMGERKREIQVFLDKDKLIANRVSVQQVKAALIAQNMELPGGRIDEGRRELVVRTMGRLTSPQDFNEIVVTSVNGRPIKVSDLGRVVDGVVEPRNEARVEGRRAVSLMVRKQSGTNTVEVADEVRRRLENLKASLPPDIKIDIRRDQSRFIKESMNEIKRHLVLGGILTSIVLLLFIGNIRTALIAATAIPASLITTFLFAWAQGFTLNMMTMLALALAIGIVIDDAIVVLENIFRYIEEKKYLPAEAAKAATREIGLAVMATTFSLVVIFLPIAFMGGLTGRFMREFGMTMAVAIMVSLLVAFTLTPMLAARFIKKPKEGEHRGSKESFFYSAIERSYMACLRWSLRYRAIVIPLAILIFLASFPLFNLVGKDVLPKDDQSEFLVSLRMPEGTTLPITAEVVQQAGAEIQKLEGVMGVFSGVGAGGRGDVTRAFIHVRLVDVNKRKLSQFQIMAQARRILKQFPNVRAGVEEVGAIRGGGFRQTPVNFYIRGPELQELERVSEEVMARMRQIPGIVDVDTSMASRKPEFRVFIDREKAADMGVRVADIADSLNILIAGQEVTKYKEADEQYEVRLRLRESDRTNFQNILEMSVPSSKNGLVRLKNLIRIEEGKGPVEIERQERQRQVTIVANLSPGKALGEALEQVRAAVRDVDFPPGYTTGFTGSAKFLKEVGQNFALAFLLSTIFMYMVLAAQFESFVQPLIIMTAMPLTIPFAILSIYLTAGTLNIYSILGILLLFGIVKKNSILQVDYTNTLRQQGVELKEAILQANRVRLRPILMTTVTLVVAMLPTALGRGAGAGSRSALATVVIGGQSLSLLITLLITPIAYLVVEDIKRLRIPAWIKEKIILGYNLVNNRRS